MRFLPLLLAVFVYAHLPIARLPAAEGRKEGEPTVISRTVTRTGAHAVIFERIAPPMPIERPPHPEVIVPPRSRPERETAKEHVMFFCFATVSGRGSELRGSHGGHEWRAGSSIDFNHLAGVSGFETEDTAYSLLVLVANAPHDSAARGGSAPSQVSGRGSDRSSFSFVDPVAGSAPPEVIDALDALHAFYDVSRERLIEEHHLRQAEREARERALREHPPTPQDTVIRFWPKRNSVYLRDAGGSQP